ncbi:MAG: 1-deoxy-D-xylulose-5-phosphate reductoisomerase [Gammaproteobacteria bacterium]|nr:1-deoxy-D-xylulose-5-phosphate reductoisomerase [Gammaproteobacteria bacterium]
MTKNHRNESPQVKRVCILGSTGSIGVSTLDVIARHPDRYLVVGLSANSRIEALFQQCLVHKPAFVSVTKENDARTLSEQLIKAGLEVDVLVGEEGLIQMAESDQSDYVMAAIVGAAGLRPTLAAAQAGKRVLLANKESLVMAGRLFMDAVFENGAELLPIDSEHNAIFQCLPKPSVNGRSDFFNSGVRKILLTASGGPFLNTPVEELSSVTVKQACAHPNWDMGRKISVDSATMMNKGLELIEACWLFDAKPEQVQVVIHPESIVHSMVDYIDGSVLAQLGNPDMRTPIAYGLSWPDRIDSGVPALDLFSQHKLTFSVPDLERFPCLRLAYEAMESGGSAPAVLNAANEEAVAAFLAEQIRFDQIPSITEQVLNAHQCNEVSSISQVLELDKHARHEANQFIKALS